MSGDNGKWIVDLVRSPAREFREGTQFLIPQIGFVEITFRLGNLPFQQIHFFIADIRSSLLTSLQRGGKPRTEAGIGCGTTKFQFSDHNYNLPELFRRQIAFIDNLSR